MTEANLPENAEILLYGTEDGTVKVDVLYRDESFWLTQKRMAELFGVQRLAITKHLKNIFETRDLDEDSVCSILEHTAADGKTYRTQYYNLDAIIAVGYQVNSRQATRMLKYLEPDFSRLANNEGMPYHTTAEFQIAENVYYGDKRWPHLH